MRDRFDVIIVGASIAGSSLAIRLGREHLRVLLIDKATFPRRKACGEGLSHLGVLHLRELGLDTEASTLPHSNFYGYTVWSSGKAFEIPFAVEPENGNDAGLKQQLNSRYIVSGCGIRRTVLDTELLAKAQAEETVTTQLGQPVRSIQRVEDRYVLTIDHAEFSAPYLVLADGAHSRLAAKLGFPSRDNSEKRYGYSMILEGRYLRESKNVHILLHRGFEVVCTPVGTGLLNVSALASRSAMTEVTAKQNVKHLLSEIESKLGFVGEPISSPIAIGPIGSRTRQTADSAQIAPNVLLIGDCMENLDPIGGMGMTHALISSTCAAAAITKSIYLESTWEEAVAEYLTERELAIRPLRGFTRATYLTLHALGNRPAFDILSRTGIPAAVSRAINQRHSISSAAPGFTLALLSLLGS